MQLSATVTALHANPTTCRCRALDYNFFLCLPLATPSITAGFEAFREQVLADAGATAAGELRLVGTRSWWRLQERCGQLRPPLSPPLACLQLVDPPLLTLFPGGQARAAGQQLAADQPADPLPLRTTSCLASTRPAGLEPSLFMDPRHLHLTIAMLKLYRSGRRGGTGQAAEAVQVRLEGQYRSGRKGSAGRSNQPVGVRVLVSTVSGTRLLLRPRTARACN